MYFFTALKEQNFKTKVLAKLCFHEALLLGPVSSHGLPSLPSYKDTSPIGLGPTLGAITTF
jgi:hypothetical protein